MFWLDNTIDRNFNIWKKYRLLNLRRTLYRKVCYHKYVLFLSEKLISDLIKIITDYM